MSNIPDDDLLIRQTVNNLFPKVADEAAVRVLVDDLLKDYTLSDNMHISLTNKLYTLLISSRYSQLSDIIQPKKIPLVLENIMIFDFADMRNTTDIHDSVLINFCKSSPQVFGQIYSDTIFKHFELTPLDNAAYALVECSLFDTRIYGTLKFFNTKLGKHVAELYHNKLVQFLPRCKFLSTGKHNILHLLELVTFDLVPNAQLENTNNL